MSVFATLYFVSRFQGLNIIYVSKKESRRVLQNKISQIEDVGRKVTPEQLDDLVLTINLNVVALYFEALIKDEDGNLVQLCPPLVSTPIQHNSKNIFAIFSN